MIDTKASRVLCKHCSRETQARLKRGLCFRCYANLDIRNAYPCAWTNHSGGCNDSNGGYSLPAEPTAELPGSPGKFAVLTARAAVGCALWHPQDAQA